MNENENLELSDEGRKKYKECANKMKEELVETLKTCEFNFDATDSSCKECKEDLYTLTYLGHLLHYLNEDKLFEKIMHMILRGSI